VKFGPRRELLRDTLFAVSFVGLLFVGLGRPELMDPDESRHGVIARTMLAERQFLTPKLYGEAYYDKPVGFHWTVAASLATFGPTAAAVRFPSALAALATLATTAWWAWRIRDATAARLAAAMLGTSLLFVALGRFGGIDMLFTALLTAAVARLSVAAGEATASPRSALLSYALVALATLVKGPAAVVLILPALVTAWIATHQRSAAWLVPWRGAATILAIAAPWYVAAARADPVYIRTFLLTHNVARFAGTETLGHQSSLAYYAITLPLAFLPWTPLIVGGSVARVRAGARWTAAELVLAAWILTVLVAFSLAGTKLITYLLPAFPALAVLAATGLVDAWRGPSANDRMHAWLPAWTRLWGVAVSITVATAMALRIASAGFGSGEAIATGVAVPVIAAYVAALSRTRGPASVPRSLAALAVGTVIAAGGAYGPVADLLTATRGYRTLGAELARDLPPDSVVVSLARAPHALSFYSGRTVGRVDDLDAARSALAVDRAVMLLTKQKYADALTADPTSTIETVWRNAQGTTLLANARAAREWRRREGVEPSADHDGRHHGFEDRSGHRTRSLSPSRDHSDRGHP
jgi:4-amino-4-deoxy-L-arabinose transferase-like glycosyltransferase